jgi:hypothetical protein
MSISYDGTNRNLAVKKLWYSYFYLFLLTTLPVELVYRAFDHLDNWALLFLIPSCSPYFKQILTELHVEYIHIGEKGAQHLANALKQNQVTFSSTHFIIHSSFCIKIK